MRVIEKRVDGCNMNVSFSFDETIKLLVRFITVELSVWLTLDVCVQSCGVGFSQSYSRKCPVR